MKKALLEVKIPETYYLQSVDVFLTTAYLLHNGPVSLFEWQA